jgi:hypothetical protein
MTFLNTVLFFLLVARKLRFVYCSSTFSAMLPVIINESCVRWISSRYAVFMIR